MIYHKFGSLDVNVSLFGMGCMRLPDGGKFHR